MFCNTHNCTTGNTPSRRPREKKTGTNKSMEYWFVCPRATARAKNTEVRVRWHTKSVWSCFHPVRVGQHWWWGFIKGTLHLLSLLYNAPFGTFPLPLMLCGTRTRLPVSDAQGGDLFRVRPFDFLDSCIRLLWIITPAYAKTIRIVMLHMHGSKLHWLLFGVKHLFAQTFPEKRMETMCMQQKNYAFVTRMITQLEEQT